MPILQDVSVSSIHKDDPQKQMESMAKQLNDWGRALSNEKRTDVYKDNSGTNRILIGVLPDGTTGIVVSVEGVDVTTLF